MALGQSAQITIEGVETAGMSGFRAHWDQPVVLQADAELTITDNVVKDRGGAAVWKDGQGAIAFDALNRAVLVRFPDAAEAIAEKIRQGFVVTKAEIILPFRDEELWAVGNSDYIGPDGYTVRKNWGVDGMYREVRPEWHAVAWALRKPWVADPEQGPTFNANVNGSSYWARFGATDTEKDRFPEMFGPAEVSHRQTEGRLDVTDALTKPEFGKTLAQRLRDFSDNGFLIQKWETYDARYFSGVYEWATATGGRAIVVNQPKLVISFEKGKADVGKLPPPVDIAKVKGGQPTARIPSPDELKQLAADYGKKPEGMSDWQWAHVRELLSINNPEGADEPFWFQFVPSHIINNLAKAQRRDGQVIRTQPIDLTAAYHAWVDGIIGRQARGWSGFESAREMTQWYIYGEALPGPARDAIKRYWVAWLMPDRDTAPRSKHRDIDFITGELVHPMVQDDRVGKGPPPNPTRGIFDKYWEATGDWQGNKSFFRSGFNYWLSTQNFNTTAMAGALLAGALIGSDRAMADGRNGAETFPLRTYSWADGSGQEHLDHYYYAVTVSGNKAVADFSGTPYDLLLGQSLMVKNMEELIGAYHPGLRSYISGASRTSLEYLIGKQDGLQYIMHTVSPSGALRDRGVRTLPGNIPVIGSEVPPRVVAQQTISGDWIPDWVIPMVDDKILPLWSRHTQWGGGMRSTYMGQNYGLFSTDTGGGRIQTMAQWRREPKQVESAFELGTLDVRLGVNDTNFINTAGGVIYNFGSHSTLQHENKLLFIGSPRTWGGGFAGTGNVRDDVMSLQASVGFFTLQDEPTWAVYVDGKKVESFPFKAKQGQRITIKDGVTYIGVIPLPAPDLGRDTEVLITRGEEQLYDNKITFQAALLINSYLYKSDKPFYPGVADKWVDAGKTYAGFIIELGDESEYGSFEAFQKHMASTQLSVAFDSEACAVAVDYVSGNDHIEAVSLTYNVDKNEQVGANFVSRSINDGPVPLPQGVERDTPYSQQAIARAEKNGAVLQLDEKRKAFVLTEPTNEVYSAWNPLPDLSNFRFEVPGGWVVSSDGLVGMTRVVAFPKLNRIEIDQQFKPGQETDANAAKTMLIAGAATAPTVVLNGKTLSRLNQRTVDGQSVLVVPLD